MKILILSTKLPYPPKDGGAIATLGLAEGLADAGLDVTLLTINTRKHFFPVEQIPKALRTKIRFYAVHKDTSPRISGAILNLLFSRQPYISIRFKSAAFLKKLDVLLAEGDFDIVQMEGPYLAYALPLTRKYPDIKISLRAHNIEHEIWKRRAENSSSFPARLYFRLLAGRIRRLEKALVAQCDLVVAISERDRARLAEFNPSAASITIPAGIDLSKYSMTKADPAEKLCFIGALDWAPNEEGLRWFIGACLPMLQQQNPAIELHVAGRNAPPEFARELRDTPGVHYHGEVEDALTFMRSFRVMIAPLLTGSGIRIKILEGMAAGMCIVTSPIGAEGIDALHERHLLIAESPEDFARNVQHTLKNRELQERMGREARAFVKEKFDTFTVASNLVSFYKNPV